MNLDCSAQISNFTASKCIGNFELTSFTGMALILGFGFMSLVITCILIAMLIDKDAKESKGVKQ